MGNDQGPFLSSEIENHMESLFDVQSWPAVRKVLLAYADVLPPPGRPQEFIERIQFDLLHLSGGDLTKLNQLASVAALDSRDVMAQEYFSVAGRYYPHQWARRHAVNRDADSAPAHATNEKQT